MSRRCRNKSENDLGQAHLAIWMEFLEVGMDNSANLIFMVLEVNNSVFLTVTSDLVRQVSKITQD